MARLPPDPITGLEAATSGVAQAQPKPPGAGHGRIIVSPAILSSERIGEVGVVEKVKELGAELGSESLSKFPVFCYGKIPVAEARVAENIAAHGSLGPGCRWNHYRVALHVAAESVE